MTDPRSELEQRLLDAGERELGSREAAERYLPRVLANLNARVAAAGQECIRCHLFKPLAAFSDDASRDNGLRLICRTCDNELRALRGTR